ncbi:MAG: hypothetical protein R3E98_21380 [Gemmatimonadota bacterium]
MRRTSVLGLLLAPATALSASCGARTEAGPSFQVRDSAGVEIVTSTAPAWSERETWSVDPAPRLVLGGGSADTGEELWDIRALAVLPGERTAVALGTAGEVRIYDAEGARVLTIGADGDGPGEFRDPRGLALQPPDTLLVLDRERIQTFLLDGTLLATTRLPPPNSVDASAYAFPMNILPDRSVLAVVSRGPSELPSGIFRPDQGAAVYGPTGTTTLLGWGRGIEQEMLGEGARVMPIVAPFARYGHLTAGGSAPYRYAVADNGTYEIRIFDGSGAVRQIVRRIVEPVPVQTGWVEAWKEEQRQASWTQRRLPDLERGWSSMTVNETLPAFERFLVDQQDHLWVEQVRPTSVGPTRYDVFAPEGRYLGSVTLPDGYRPIPEPVITRDRFVGVWADAMDVETVRVYALRTPVG